MSKFKVGEEVYLLDRNSILKLTVENVRFDLMMGQYLYSFYNFIPKRLEDCIFKTQGDAISSMVIFDYTKKTFEREKRIVEMRSR